MAMLKVFLTRSHSDTKLYILYELTPGLLLTYEKNEASVGVLCVTLVFRGVKFGQVVTI